MKWKIVLCIFATFHLALLAGILVDSVLSRTAVEKAVEEGKNKLSEDMAEKIGKMKKEITSFNEDVFNTTRVNQIAFPCSFIFTLYFQGGHKETEQTKCSLCLSVRYH